MGKIISLTVKQQEFTVSEADKALRTAEKKAAKLAALPVKTPEEIEAEAEARQYRKLKYHREYQRE